MRKKLIVLIALCIAVFFTMGITAFAEELSAGSKPADESLQTSEFFQIEENPDTIIEEQLNDYQEILDGETLDNLDFNENSNLSSELSQLEDPDINVQEPLDELQEITENDDDDVFVEAEENSAEETITDLPEIEDEDKAAEDVQPANDALYEADNSQPVIEETTSSSVDTAVNEPTYLVTISNGSTSVNFQGGTAIRIADILNELGRNVSNADIIVDPDSIDTDVISVYESEEGLMLSDLGPFSAANRNLVLYVNGEAVELTITDPTTVQGGKYTPETFSSYFTQDSNIILDGDVVVESYQNYDNTILLDFGKHDIYLNGHTLTLSGSAYFDICYNGTVLNIYGGGDKTSAGSGVVTSSETSYFAPIHVVNKAALNVYSGTIKDVSSNQANEEKSAIVVRNGGIITVDGGSVQGKSNQTVGGIGIFSQRYDKNTIRVISGSVSGSTCAISNIGNGVSNTVIDGGSVYGEYYGVLGPCTVNGGNVKGDVHGVYGNCTINGGTVSGGSNGIYVDSDVSDNSGSVIIFGGGISGKSSAIEMTSGKKLTVYGGAFSGKVSTGKIPTEIYGGLFTVSPANYVASNYKVIGTTGSYKFNVVPMNEVAEIEGGNKYASVADAVAAAAVESDVTICLLRDLTENIEISGKSISLNPNGYKLTGSLTAKDKAFLSLCETGSIEGKLVIEAESTAVLRDATFKGDINVYGSLINLSVNADNLKDAKLNPQESYGAEAKIFGSLNYGQYNITCGYFSDDPSSHLAKEYATKYSSTDQLRYKVIKSVAYDSNKGYTTLQNAIDNNTGAAIITLVYTNKTFKESFIIPSGKTIEINLNNCSCNGTFTVEGNLKLYGFNTYSTYPAGKLVVKTASACVDSDLSKFYNYDISAGNFTNDPFSYLTNEYTSVEKNTSNPYKYTVEKSSVVDDKHGYSGIQDAFNRAESNAVLKLLHDAKENATLDNTKTFTLDLNGFVLDGNAGNVLTVKKGTLTIKDSNPTSIHTGNYARLISGGAITHSDTNNSGSGILVESEGNLIISGGTIIGNIVSTDNCGAGITNLGKLTILGGTIAGNITKTEKGAGGIYHNGSSLTLGGSAFVVHNFYRNTDTFKESNLFLAKDKTIEISSDTSFESSATIGISIAAGQGNPYKLTTSGKSDDVKYFVSDRSASNIQYNTSEYLELNTPASPATPVQVGSNYYSSVQDAVNANNTGTIILNADLSNDIMIQIGTGKTLTINLNGHTLTSDLIVNGSLTITGFDKTNSSIDGSLTVELDDAKVDCPLSVFTGYDLTAGYFSSDPASYLEKEYAVETVNDDATYKYKVVPAVVCTDTKGYISVKDAVSDVKETSSGAAKLTMLNDSTEDTVTVKEGQNIDLNLNGQTLKADLEVSGNLTLKDDSETATGGVDGNLSDSESGDLSILSGQYSDDPTEYLDKTLYADNSATDAYNVLPAVACDENRGYGDVQSAIDANSDSTIVLLTDIDEDIEIAEGKNIELDTASHNLSGSVTVNGALKMNSTAPVNATLIVSSAKAHLLSGIKLFASHKLTAGQFDEDPSEYLDFNFASKNLQDKNSYKVTEAVADDGKVCYASLSEAINNTSGHIITLLRDTNEDVVFTKSSKMIINLLKHTLTGNVSAMNEAVSLFNGTVIGNLSVDNSACILLIKSALTGNMDIRSGVAAVSNSTINGDVSNNGKLLMNNTPVKGTLSVQSESARVNADLTSFDSCNLFGGCYTNDPSAYITKESIVVSNEDDRFIFRVIPATAHDGTKGFADVTSVLDYHIDDKSSFTITLLKDTNESPININNQIVVLDLNSHFLTGNVCVNNNSSLTVTDSQEAITGLPGGICGSIIADSTSSVLLKSGLYSERPNDKYITSDFYIAANTDEATKDIYPYRVLAVYNEVRIQNLTVKEISLESLNAAQQATVKKLTVDSNNKLIAIIDASVLDSAQTVNNGGKLFRIIIPARLIKGIDVSTIEIYRLNADGTYEKVNFYMDQEGNLVISEGYPGQYLIISTSK